MNLKYPTVQKKLIAAGVRNLKEFGYPDCNEENILTDPIYSAFFKGMLKDNRECSPEVQAEFKAIQEQAEEAGRKFADALKDQPPAPKDERAEFEKWQKGRGASNFGRYSKRNGQLKGQYISSVLEHEWEAWCARAVLEGGAV